jgi:LysR family transcriptional regulator, regulator for genes of the gallate degradation pathway
VTFSLAEQLIMNSDAIGLLTYSSRKRDTLREGLTKLPVELPHSEREIGLTFRKHQPLTVAQKAFVGILAEEAAAL